MSTKNIKARLDELLKPIGFVRHKDVWNRKFGTFIDVIDIQTSKAGDTITINSGVLNSEVSKLFSGAPLGSTNVDEPSCTVRARVGQLIDDKDLWWSLSDSAIEKDVVEKVVTYVLPFLERMHSIEAMEQFLIDANVVKKNYPPPIIYLALLKMKKRGQA